MDILLILQDYGLSVAKFYLYMVSTYIRLSKKLHCIRLKESVVLRKITRSYEDIHKVAIWGFIVIN